MTFPKHGNTFLRSAIEGCDLGKEVPTGPARARDVEKVVENPLARFDTGRDRVYGDVRAIRRTIEVRRLGSRFCHARRRRLGPEVEIELGG
jgi:hypothetical protein